MGGAGVPSGFCPGEFSKEASQKASVWNAPLRDPALSHEYAFSRLDKLENPPAFKQKFIPTHCDDMIPHKYVLPQSEQEFIMQARPGVFWRIVDGLAAKAEGPPTAVSKHAPVVVKELSHLVRNMPVTVLAVYANGKCDVEVAPVFIHAWEQHPDRPYTILVRS